MVLQYPSIVLLALLLALLIGGPFANGEELQVIITKKEGLPTLQATTSSGLQHSASPSSYYVTFTPAIPNASTNRYIYRGSQRDGTVFIAAGTCIGVIILASFVIWLILTVRAWNSAREEYRSRELKNKCQYDPLFFAGEPDFYDSATDISDTGDTSSDISEEVLKTKTSDISIYNLGSTSALNLLNQVQPSYAAYGAIDPNASFVNTSNMFISPTEALRNESNNSRSTWNLVLNKAPLGSDRKVPDSDPPARGVRALTQKKGRSSTCILPPTLKNSALDSSDSNLNSSSPHAILIDINDDANISTNQQPTSIRVKDYRPPSAHLDTLLDHSL